MALRRAWHVCPAVIEYGLLACGFTPAESSRLIAPLGGACVALDVARHRLPTASAFFEANGLKPCERGGLTGTSYYVMGVYINLLAATWWPATQRLWFLGLWFLAFGDPAAALVGSRCGRYVVARTAGKTVEGTCACFAACICIAVAFLSCPSVGAQLPLQLDSWANLGLIAFTGAAVAALTELHCKGVTDNLCIAPAASLSMAVVHSLLADR